MNLEVDVMEGDGFVQDYDGKVVQRRDNKDRQIGLHAVGRWFDHVPIEMPIKNIDLPTFTRYCQGCGLTVKEVKPEPQVETIKPPEWGVMFLDGHVILFASHQQANQVPISPDSNARVVRIDWGAK